MKKRYRMLISKLLVILLLFSALGDSGMGLQKVYAEGNQLSSEDFWFNNVELKYNGQEVDPDTPIEPSDTSVVSLFYNWEISDSATINAGDYAQITVPAGFTGNSLTGRPLVDAGGETVGHFDFDKNTRTLKLTFEGTDLLGIKGTVQLDTFFNFSSIGNNNPAGIDFAVTGSAIKYIKFQPKGVTSYIEKKGSPNKAVNADKITWSIDVNKKLEHLYDTKITDAIPEGLIFDASSVAVYDLPVNIDGTTGSPVATGSAIGVTEPSASNGNTLTVALGEITSAYRIEFTTSLSDTAKKSLDGQSFENKALLNAKDINNATIDTQATSSVPVNRGKLLEKSGMTDTAYNPSSITWTIYANKAESELTNATVEDIIPAGLSYDASAIKFYSITLDSNGNEVSSSEVSGWTGAYDDTTRKLTLTAPGTINQAYKIIYKTNIEDRSELLTAGGADKTYTNNAKISADEINSGTPGTTAVAKVTVKRGDLLTKNNGVYSIGYGTEKYITWTIDVNTAKETIEGAKLKDTFGTILKLMNMNGSEISTGGLPGAIEVYDLNVADDGTLTQGSKLTVDESKLTYEKSGSNNIGYSYTMGNISSPYRIIYKTKIIDVTKSEFPNEAALTGHIPGGIGPGPGTNEDISIPLTKKATPPISTTFSKTADIDYSDNAIDWTINIKPLNDGMKNLKIVDTFSNGGLKLKNSTIKVEVKTGSIYTEVDPSNYSISKTSEETETGTTDWLKGFVLEFNTATHYVLDNAEYRITYTTGFERALHTEPSDSNNYKNTAKLTWNGVIDTAPKTKDVPRDCTIDSKAHNNGYKEGFLDNDYRKIRWEINVNHLSEKYSVLTVEDPILGEQDLDLSSVQVYTYEINKAGNITTKTLAADSVYTDASSANNIKIKFLNINEPYKIVFETKLRDRTQLQYDNTAKVSGIRDGKAVQDTLNANVAFAKADTFLVKTGAINPSDGTKIDWKIDLNSSLSTISKATLKDVLSTGHEYVEGSLKVYKLSANGNETEVPSTEYTSNIDVIDLFTNRQSLTVKFNNPINSEYLVKYQTVVTITTSGQYDLSNTVNLTGDNSYVANQNDDYKVKVMVTSGSGTATGTKGKLKITKINGTTGEKLSGVEFQLLQGGIVKGTAQTNAQGEILINRLNFGDYVLREATPSAGYIVPDVTDIPIKIDSVDLKAITVKNYKTRKLIINKKNASGALLNGAEFTVTGPKGYNKDVTAENGTVTLKDLDFGTYVIIETKAPQGYQINGNGQITLTIDDKTDEVITKNIINAAVTPTPTGTATPTPTGTTTPTPVSPTPTEPTGTPVSPTPTEPTGTPVSPTPTVPTNTPTGPTPTGSANTTSTPTPTPTAAVSTTPVPTKTPSATPKPTATVSTTPAPTKTPSSTPTPAPSSKPTLTPTPTPKPIIEITPENTPKGGKVPVPEGSTASPGQKPDNGKITVDKNGKWTYTPEPGFTGKDEFTITVTHPDGKKEEVVVHIDVNKVPFGNPDNGKKGSGDNGSDDNGKGVHIPKTGEKIPMAVLPVAITGIVAGIIAFAGRKKKLGNSK